VKTTVNENLELDDLLLKENVVFHEGNVKDEIQ
jgi:hypothetical protein